MWLTSSSSGRYGVLGKDNCSRGEENGSESHLEYPVWCDFARAGLTIRYLQLKTRDMAFFCRLQLQVLHRKPSTRDSLAMDIEVLNFSAARVDSVRTPVRHRKLFRNEFD